MDVNNLLNRYSESLRTIYRRYLKTLGYSKYLSRYLFRIIQSGIYIAVTLILINLLGLYLGKSSTLGAFGDFIGGTLNPVFTFLMLIGLIVTIVLQKTELSLARKEFSRSADALRSQDKNLEYQRFENTFFKLLEFLELCRNDIFYQGFQGSALDGRDAIKKMYDIFINHKLHHHEHHGLEDKKTFIEECKEVSGIKEKYNIFYKEHYGEELGQYFRTLYNILKFVESSKVVGNKNTYTNLLRAQLSRYELSLLFYNCLSDFGEEKMTPLVKKYKILKHLEVSILPIENIHLWEEFNA